MKLSINYYLTLISIFFLISFSITKTNCHKSHKVSNTKESSETDKLSASLIESSSVSNNKKSKNVNETKQSGKSNKNAKHEQIKNKKTPSDIVTYDRIKTFMHEYAKVAQSRSDVNLKKRIAGSLDANYPSSIRAKSRKMHYDKKVWNHIMLYPSKVYRFCIFPSYELNYQKWCEEKYSPDKKKTMNCQNTFCAVCCDNLQIMFRNQADGDVLGDLLLLSKASGYKTIQQTATKTEIKECRKACKDNFPAQFPEPKLPVPRDPLLGKFSNTPATSCADIKRWGDIKAESASYWIKLNGKGTVQVYCDMYAMQGGWTLFFNYLRMPNSKVKISKSKLPSSLKENSHINLKDGGFNENQVKELRFFCTEKSDNKYFWHFRTGSASTIATAFSGDQSKMKLQEFKNEYSEMVFPGQALLWTRSMGQQQAEEDLDYLGKSKSGGFWDKPFGSRSLKKNWIVKGTKKEEEWSCGTEHSSTNENDQAYTHHTVFFRGDAPDEEFARARYYHKQIKGIRKKLINVAIKKANEN